MEKFRQELRAFVEEVYEGEKKVLVFGEGLPCARVMLIGEAPGREESLQGRPFVGRAGKNLNDFLQAAHLLRNEMYVSNVVKFRPTRVSGAGNIVNRPPTQEEIGIFLPWLKREIKMVAPEWIVTLGNVPLKALLGPKVNIGACHGGVFSFEGAKLFPMYHPASIMYNPSLKETYARDMDTFAGLLAKNEN